MRTASYKHLQTQVNGGSVQGCKRVEYLDRGMIKAMDI